ncbi:hypothetical protein PLICRDRAFT_457400 [Plicaturopsis crispa FD-325 SS-3]|nr:hypothetical protein PLICRDRAFT_457400 [Plicaturopsis crispa FD-325 SS-3]
MQAYPQSYDAGPSYPLMDPSAQSTQMQMPAPAASHDPAASAPFPLAPAHFTTFEAMASRTEPQTHVFVMYDPSRHYASAPQREDTPAAIPSRSPHILPESYMRDGSAPADFDALHALEASASPAPPSDVGGSGMGDDLASYELGNRDGSHEAGSSSSSLRATPARGSKEDSRSRNNNPNGRNQYKDCPPPNDPRVRDALLAYHRRGITDRKKISKLLKEEHGIIMSDTSVSRRRRALDLHGSAHETANTPLPLARLLIHAHMSANPAWGPRAVRKALLKGNGVLFTRDFIADEMRRVDPRGFAERHPHAQKAAKQARQGRRKSVESGQDKDQEHGQEREQDDDDAAMSVSDTR